MEYLSDVSLDQGSGAIGIEAYPFMIDDKCVLVGIGNSLL
jgi:hypothetical protein